MSTQAATPAPASLEHDIKRWIKDGVKDALKDVLHPMEADIDLIAKPFKTEIPAELKKIESGAVSLGKKLVGDIPHLFDHLEKGIDSIRDFGKNDITFDPAKGAKWKGKLTNWASDFKVTFGNLEAMSQKTDFLDSTPFEVGGQFLDKVAILTSAAAEEMLAPIDFMDPYLRFYDCRDRVQTFIETLEGALPVAAGDDPASKVPKKTKRDVAIALLAASVATSAFVQAANYVISSFPVTLKLGVSGGVAIVIDGEAGASVDFVNLTSAVLGIFAGLAAFLLDVLNSFIGVLDHIL
jgi:hypothetical protein